MDKGTFQDGFLDGWRGVAGDAPPPPLPDPAPKPERGFSEFEAGHEYGRAEALMRFSPAETSRAKERAQGR